MKNISQKRRHFVLRLGQALGVAGVSSISPQVFAEARGRRANINSVVLKKSANGQSRLVFELDKSIRHKIFTLAAANNKPNRVVIDFINTSTKSKLSLGRNGRGSLVNKIRHASRDTTNYRVVLDLAEQAAASAKLKSNGSSYFLEVALSPKNKPITVQEKVKKAINVVGRGSRRKPIIVAIDAGHGGRDSGAVGKKKTLEKDIVLQIAKRLEKHVNSHAGMRAVLIRKGDYLVSLRKRIRIAHANKADLFISIHADANTNRRVSGSTVYVLNEKGASSEAARMLAHKENAFEKTLISQHMSGNKYLDGLLMGLSQEKTLERSVNFADNVLRELGSFNRLLRGRRVESANFMVLKSPDIPSILVETAFISNPIEEQRLKTKAHQEKIAKAIFKGVRQFQKIAQNESSTRYT